MLEMNHDTHGCTRESTIRFQGTLVQWEPVATWLKWFCRLLALILFTSFCSATAFAQVGEESEEPFWTGHHPGALTPTAASISQFGSIPVGLNTGTPNIQVPLHVAQGATMDLPLTLNYHASGIKVDQVAGWVGLGWALRAGGVITRSVRGIPDDWINKGYLHTRNLVEIYHDDPENDWPTESHQNSYWQDMIDRVRDARIDTAPDVFVLNLPTTSEKFYLRAPEIEADSGLVLGPSPNGEAEFVGHKNIDVQWERNGDLGFIKSFVVTTSDGTKYHFGGEISDPSVGTSGAKPEVELYPVHPVSWHLVKIVSPDGAEEITFGYGNSIDDYPNLEGHRPVGTQSSVVQFLSCIANESEERVHSHSDVNRKFPQQPYLKSISTTKEKIRFITQDRADAYGFTLLDKIVVKRLSASGQGDPGETLWKRIDLEYEYMNASGNAYQKRPLLKSVQEEGHTGQRKPPYRFTYDRRHSLPEPFTGNAIDSFGYHTGTAQAPYPHRVPPTGKIQRADGAAQAGILREIEYPTGGRTELDYELHVAGWVGQKAFLEAEMGGPSPDGSIQPSNDGPGTDRIDPGDDPDPDPDPYPDPPEDSPTDTTGTSPPSTGNWGDYEYTVSAGANDESCTVSTPCTGNGSFYIPLEVDRVKITTSFSCDFDVHPDGKCGASVLTINQGELGFLWHGPSHLDPQEYDTSFPTRNYGPFDRFFARGHHTIEAKVMEPGVIAAITVRYYGSEPSGDGEHHPGSDPTDVEPHQVGGLRIQEIRSYPASSSSEPVVKTFSYHEHNNPSRSSGVLVRRPSHEILFDPVYATPDGSGSRHYAPESCRIVASSTSPLISAGVTSGSHIAYRHVSVAVDGAGETHHVFRSAVDSTRGGVPLYDAPVDGLGSLDFVDRSWVRGQKTATRKYLSVSDTRAVRVWENEVEYDETRDPVIERFPEIKVRSYPYSKSTHTPHHVALPWSEAGWVHPTRTLEHTVDPDSQKALVSETKSWYVRDPSKTTYGLVDSVRVRTSNRQHRTQHFKYAHEVHPGMAEDHALSQIYSTEVTDSLGLPLSKKWVTWTQLAIGWRPDALYRWTGDGSGRDTSVTPLDNSSEVVLEKEVLLHDFLGRPMTIVSASGEATNITYGGVNNAYVYSVISNDDTTSYFYNQRGFVDEIVDPNGWSREFTYDGFGRLNETYSPLGKATTTTYRYAGNAVASDPNSVRTTQHGGESPSVSTSEYLDGLGRPWQTHVHTSQGRIVQATSHDDTGRPDSTYRPFHQASDDFKPAIPDGAASTATYYEDSPLNRSHYVINPDATYRSTSYGVASAPTDGFCGRATLEGSYAFTSSVDEEGDIVRTYQDAFGQTVATVADPGGIAATTCFEYDAAGNLTRVTKPEGDAVTYRYDRRGLLVERTSPDAGTTTMTYDAAGNLRFSRDANRAAADEFVFTTYDPLGRPLVTGTETGVTESMFDALDPNVAQPFETDDTTWRHVRVYDVVPSSSQHPWDAGAPQIDASEANLKGRLTAQAHRSNGSWRVVYFTYDADGRIARKFVRSDVDPSLDADIAYTYDQQGRLRNRTVRIPASAEGVAYWYKYNDRGLVDAMYAKQDPGPSPARPPFPDLQLTYTADQQIDTLRFHGLEPIAYDHTSRGFVASIGAQSPYFHASYSYYDDGNVSSVTAFQPGLGSGAGDTFTYAFGYDPLDRLVAGNFNHAGDNRFDVSLTYDPNGNIKTLRRHGSTGEVLDDLTYTYDSGVSGHSDSPNRLRSIADEGMGTTAWDARGGGFSYDPSGNMLQSPAPYALQAVTYNEENLPTEVSTPAGTTHYHYSAGGQRTRSILPGGDTEVTIRDGSVAIGRFRNGDLEHWNLVLPSGEVVGRIQP